MALVASPALAGKYNKVISVGEKAPAFSGVPAIMGEKEATLYLDDLTAKDKAVVLVFLANHCPVVTAYEDRIIDFANDYKAKGIKVVGVCVDVSNEQDKLPGIKQRVKDEATTTWVKPKLVGEVKFTEWTSGGEMRHPAFVGLREDKKPEQVVLEKELHRPA